MIKISMKRFNKVVELQLPTEYEHVMVCLWKLGLERDPAKYTLRDLNAVISYDTPWEHQIIRLVSIGNTLEEAADTADKIEMINSLEFAIRVKQWSVLTDRGLLFILGNLSRRQKNLPIRFRPFLILPTPSRRLTASRLP